MKITEVDINKLIPYEKNNKVHEEDQITQIANSIKEFWFTQPVVVDEDFSILAGHWRYYASQRLWLEKIPCYIVEWLTDAQKKKYRILDNKLNDSDWDLANLKSELESLDDMNFWELQYSKYDMFPELNTEEFNPDDYKSKKDLDDEEDEDSDSEADSMLSLTVYVDDKSQLQMLKKDLDELGYRYR